MMKHLRKTFTSQGFSTEQRLSNLTEMETILGVWEGSRVRETGTQSSGLVGKHGVAGFESRDSLKLDIQALRGLIARYKASPAGFDLHILACVTVNLELSFSKTVSIAKQKALTVTDYDYTRVKIRWMVRVPPGLSRLACLA